MGRVRFFLAAWLALASATASAAPGYYVVTVYDNPGIRTIDFRYWAVSPRGGATIYWPEVGIGWNVTGRWYSEVLASYIGSDNFTTHVDTLNWQNDVLLTQGQYPIDVALHTQLVAPQGGSSKHAFEFGPVLQTDVGRTQVNFNLVFEKGFGAEAGDPVELSYQWQLRHRWKPWLQFGAQGFGEVGPWDRWLPRETQSHRAGPALFGALPSGEGVVSWQAAWLWGKTYGRRGDMLTARVKYEF